MTGITGRLIAASLALALTGCDQGWSGAADAFADMFMDTGVEAADAAPDEPCTYPAGPYALHAVGDTVGPMVWPTAIRGEDETTAAADLRVLHCDPDIESIFIHVAADT
jgi:hypothetical protein